MELYLAMIDHHGDSWTATAHLCDRGSTRSPNIRESQHDTLDAAIDHIHTLAAQYPNSKDLVILVDNI